MCQRREKTEVKLPSQNPSCETLNEKEEDLIKTCSEIETFLLLPDDSLSIDLSNKGLIDVPDSLLQYTNLEFLYLNENQLSSLPKSFFHSLPNLQWLDLRDNHLTDLPSEIGSHKCLRTLLLERNQLVSLPRELGFVKTLVGLSLRNNPLQFPPTDILNKGVPSILKFLKDALLIPQTNAGNSQTETYGLMVKEEIDICGKEHFSLPNIRRTFSKTTPLRSISEPDFSLPKMTPLDMSLVKLAQDKIIQDKILQRRKDQDVLKGWRETAKILQAKSSVPNNFIEPAYAAPYGIDEHYLRVCKSSEVNSTYKHSPVTLQADEKSSRLLKAKELEDKLQKLIERIHSRQQNPKDHVENVTIAQKDLDMASELLRELQQLRLDSW